MKRVNNISSGFLTDLSKKDNVYLLGRIWADGSIDKHGFGLSSTVSDFEHMIPYLTASGIKTYRTRQRTQDGKPFGRPVTELEVSSHVLRDWLIGYDYHIKSGAAPTKVLDAIPTDLHPYWWRGFFDGDGCLYVGRSASLAFWSTIDQDWSELFALYERLGVEWSRSVYSRKEGKHRSSSVQMGKIPMIVKVMEYIYHGYEEDKIGLARKHAKYLEVKARHKRILDRTDPKACSGVKYDKSCDVWRAYIGRNRKAGIMEKISLGRFDTQEEARAARQKRLEEMGLGDWVPNMNPVTEHSVIGK